MTDDAASARLGRVVRVRTDVAALARDFDYAVPEAWAQDVRVGTRVRAPLHGRTVRGWVVEEGVAVPEGLDVLPLKSWLGWGPPRPVVELAAWAAWRWAGPAAFFLRTASPATVVRSLPAPPPPPGPTPGSTATPTPTPVTVPPFGWDLDLGAPGATAVRLPPATDLIELVLAVLDDRAVRARGGSTVVLVPSSGWAERLTSRLSRRGYAATTRWEEARAGWPVVVGSRAGAWSPVPRLAATVILDAHDASYTEESAPTYRALDVLLERAGREGAPCILASPVPPVALAGRRGLRTLTPPPAAERAGWPALERVDRRGADPRSGLFSEEFVRLARAVLAGAAPARGPLVCVYNRTGGARLLACRHCGELARCARCGAAATRPPDAEVLQCPRCGETRPVVCASCGRLRMKTLRSGVSRLREELAALLGVEVGEVAGRRGGGPDPALPDAPVLVGTEAVLHRVRRAASVAFLDVDLHLLAPRLSATEETLALLVRAGRLVGPRGSAEPWARVQVQSRVPDHPVLLAVAQGEPEPVLRAELAMRREAGLPPFAALALVSGVRAPAFADALVREAATGEGTVAVSSLGEDRFLVRAVAHEPLCDLLSRTPRPPGRGLRVEVDPETL
jgi:primosomal protein N' (replication factor Y)